MAVTTTAGAPVHRVRQRANKRTANREEQDAEAMLAGTVAGSTLAIWSGAAAAAANPPTASREGVVASLAAQYGPGTVAYLTHLLQVEAARAGVPMGSLNLTFAQTKGACGL